MAHKFRAATAETLTGNRTLSTTEVKTYAVWTFDPGGSARDLTLPNAADAPGEFLFIGNSADAAEVITIKADSATVCTPTQAECAVLVSTGVRWEAVVGARS